jgi:hypothetical protein
MATFINSDFPTNTESRNSIQCVEVHRVVVHAFNLGDVDDPTLYAAEPLCDWERSEAGQWVMHHSTQTPTWFCNTDHMSYGYKFIIVAWLSESDYLFFKLKF